MASYTVKQLAKVSGVSVRTLHFYDEIGLLKPSRYGENGYRYYEETELLILQQILFYRELGFPLSEIQKIIQSPDFDKAKALKTHKSLLQKRIKETHELIQTIEKTLAKLEGVPMDDNALYKGFDPKKQAEYVDYLIEKYGDSAARNIEASKQKIKGWKKSGHEKIMKDGDEILKKLVLHLNNGESPSEEKVQNLIHLHYQWICHFWKPDRVSYKGLGQLYTEHPDFRKFYEPYHPKMADFLSEAMAHYADQKLS